MISHVSTRRRQNKKPTRQKDSLPVDVVRVEAELALLDVLLDGRVGLVRRALHLGARLLGDLAHKVDEAVARVERDVVPRRHGRAGRLEKHAVVERVLGALFCLFRLVGWLVGMDCRLFALRSVCYGAQSARVHAAGGKHTLAVFFFRGRGARGEPHPSLSLSVSSHLLLVDIGGRLGRLGRDAAREDGRARDAADGNDAARLRSD